MTDGRDEAYPRPDSPIELRVLSGLHRGAVLALDGSPVTIGSSDHCDVILLDHDVAAEHLALKFADGAYQVYSEPQSQVLDQDGCAVKGGRVVDEHQLFQVGDVWIALCRPSTPWPRVPTPSARQVKADKKVPPPAAPSTSPRSFRRRAVAIGLMTLALVAAGLAAMVVRSKAPDQPGARVAEDTAMTPAPGPVDPPRPQFDEAQVSVIIRAALRDRNLDEAVTWTFDHSGVHLSGTMDQTELKRFEQLLNVLNQRFGGRYGITAAVQPIANVLPFRIVQVLKGSDSHIVLEGGRLMYEGDSVKGVQLVAVRQDKLTFKAARRFDVPW